MDKLSGFLSAYERVIALLADGVTERSVIPDMLRTRSFFRLPKLVSSEQLIVNDALRDLELFAQKEQFDRAVLDKCLTELLGKIAQRYEAEHAKREQARKDASWLEKWKWTALMNKTVKLATNNLPNVPGTLCQQGTNAPLDEIDVDLDQLCHHLFLDVHGTSPAPNPYSGYLLALLSPATELEFLGAGPATHKEARVGESNKYGKAFCRWFLYTHFGLTYFCHMDDVLRTGIPPPFNTWAVSRSKKGDTPDYLCTAGTISPCLAEAKGTQSAIAFKTAKFKA
jgi:hypothetical protein